MKDVKIFVILGSIFAILFSCSVPRQVAVEKERTKFQIIKQPTIVRDTIYNDRGMSAELRAYLESTLKDYKTDNIKQASSIEALKRYIDSLIKDNMNMFKVNSELAFGDIMNQRRILENKELLLLEIEKRMSLQKENVQLNQTKETGERYTFVLLLTGVVANLLMTITLYFYKRKQIQQLKKLNLIHA